MLIKDTKGLKYPDEVVARFFFKENLHTLARKALELGCGNGNNLSLFYQYGWDVLGVDILHTAIDSACSNFSQLQSQEKINASYKFICANMLDFCLNTSEKEFDVLLLPSSIYYLPYAEIVKLFEAIASRQLLADNAKVYLRIRDIDDYRFGKGEALGNNTFKLNIAETGEKGCVMTFFDIDSFIQLIQKSIPLKNLKKMKQCFENYQQNELIKNSEWVIWGNL